ncbi:MAG: D-glycero-alpha-D-manno-heptose 7-phosphate kinase [Syntrophaceae bacterium PtaU1.Bin231]|nr:MAG: D-glycero-alpha-D-manno-heptose 7-phosphate kinase [Syntrophaceae bacterium PtaU1.Bin231]
MIITRTPFRVSFVGGGSDLREFYARNGFGAVASAAIDKYMYLIIHPYFHDKIRLKYAKTEDVAHVDEIEHPLIRECLRKVKIERGIEIASFADVPAGTGLGSSSAFTVGLLNALYAYRGKVVSKERLAAEACEIEIDILGEPIGKQDQYAAACGSLNYIAFHRDETVNVSPILMTETVKGLLENRLCLYYIGGDRRSRDILDEQRKNTSKARAVRSLRTLVGLAGELRDRLQSGDPDALGDILHQGWLCKKELAGGISNGRIDGLYEKALANGAKGGKLLGAGGAGFLLLFAPDHRKLKKALGLRVLPFRIDREGTKIIFYES